MPDYHPFKEATDFLKFHKKIKFIDLATELGVEKHDIDNLRRGQAQPSKPLLDELFKLYPETKRFFVADLTINYGNPSLSDKVEENNMVLYSDGNAWRQLAEERKKLLDKIEEENMKLREKVTQLEAENKTLKEILNKKT